MLNVRMSVFRTAVAAGLLVLAGVSYVAAQDAGESEAPAVAPQGQVRITPRGPQRAAELVSLRRDMTWDEALDAIQRASGQVIVYNGKREAAIGVGVQNRPWDEALNMLLSANGLEKAEREGFWEIVTPVGGTAPQAAFSLKTRQVQISAVFFVADRSFLREIGVDWGTAGDGVVSIEQDPTKAMAKINEEAVAGAAATYNGGQEVSGNAFQAAGGDLVKMGSHQVRIQALLRTLETNNLGKIIASPQITVVDGKEGVVYVGRDFATTVTDFAGNAITRFHSTGVNLVVTPHVMTESGLDFIHLSIGTERSALIDPVQQIIDKTKADTEVLLYNGEETAMAGLIQSEQTHLRKGIPGLKDLPPWFFGLRYLFGYDRDQTVDKELIILMKAELVPTIEERIQAKILAPPGAVLKAKRDELMNIRIHQLEEIQ
jgi:hypothetical protein